jgi:hypothetical protein
MNSEKMYAKLKRRNLVKLNNIDHLIVGITLIGAAVFFVYSFFLSIIKSGLIHDGFFYLVLFGSLGWIAFWIFAIKWVVRKYKSKYVFILLIISVCICYFTLFFVEKTLHYPYASLGRVFLVVILLIAAYIAFRLYFKKK